MRAVRRALVAAALLFAILDLSIISLPPLVDNLRLVFLLRAMPSLQELATYWYGSGLRPPDSQQSNTIGATYYQAAPDAHPCSAWERVGLNVLAAPYLWTRAEDQPGPDQVLLSVRREECAGNISQALDILSRAPASRRKQAEQVRLLRLLGRDQDAFPIALELVCPGHPQWCAGYLRNQWYANGLATNSSLALQLAVNVMLVPDSVPAIATGITPGENNYAGNYMGYRPFPTAAVPARIRVQGEIVDSAASGCLSVRMIFFDARGNWVTESKQSYDVRGQFQVDYAAPVPAQVATVWPQITFDDVCFSAGQKVLIYQVLQVDAR